MPKTWTDLRSVPEGALHEDLKADGSYQPGGFRCWKCEFTTRKKGFPGRQAMRAHIKSHVLQRRSWQRPLARQAGLVTVLIVVRVLAHLGIIHSPIYWTQSIAPLVFWPVIGLVGLLLIVALAASVYPGVNPTRGRVRLLAAGRWLATAPPILELVLATGVVDLGLPLWTCFADWGIGMTSVWFAVAHGRCRHSLTRRRRQPSSYTAVWVPKLPGAMTELMERLRNSRSNGRDRPMR